MTGPREEILPLVEETSHLKKRQVTTGRVRIQTFSEDVEDVLTEVLTRDVVEVTRVSIGREVSEPPSTRTEQGVLIIPVLEERVVVEKRLFLVEEIQVHRRSSSEHVSVPVSLRRQRATVERADEIGSCTSAQRSEMSDPRLLTAFFDNSAEARRAMDDLVEAGVPRTQINLIEGEGSAPTGATSYEGTGFWESLKSLFVPEEDRYTYAEGLRRGGFLLSVRADASNYDTALNILDREGTVNIDERATTWREQGWAGRAGGFETGFGSSGAGDLGAGRAPGPNTSSGAERQMSNTGVPNPRTEAEKTIPLAEEKLRVGKREEGRGRVRVRSYVEEVPVNENVTLRDRNVTVEHRPVQASSASAEDAFKDRTIEAVETREEPVVSKEARVVEEVVLRESETTRDEKVSDSVRKTKVEVEDDRKPRGTGTSE